MRTAGQLVNSNARVPFDITSNGPLDHLVSEKSDRAQQGQQGHAVQQGPLLLVGGLRVRQLDGVVEGALHDPQLAVRRGRHRRRPRRRVQQRQLPKAAGCDAEILASRADVAY